VGGQNGFLAEVLLGYDLTVARISKHGILLNTYHLLFSLCYFKSFQVRIRLNNFRASIFDFHTRGPFLILRASVPDFETSGASGRARHCDVWTGDRKGLGE